MSYDRVPDRFPVLRGFRLGLRELSEEDLPAWFARLSDPLAAELAGDPVAHSIRDAIDGLQHHRTAFLRKEGLRWAIVPDEPGMSVGSIGLFRFNGAERSAELGAAIGRAHWNRGIATRAARLVLGYAFSELDLQRVEAAVLARNAAVIHVLEKLGFVRQPGLPQGRAVGGAESESIFYVLASGCDPES